MRRTQKILPLFLTILFCQFSSAQNSKIKLTSFEKTNRIDSICNKIDKDIYLVEGIAEGEYLNHKGGWETYHLKNKSGTELYRIVNNSTFEGYVVKKFYYWNQQLIKGIIEKQDWNSGKMKLIYSATYYFENKKLLKSNNENPNYSNSEKVLLWGDSYLKEFYKTE